MSFLNDFKSKPDYSDLKWSNRILNVLFHELFSFLFKVGFFSPEFSSSESDDEDEDEEDEEFKIF